MFSGKFSVKYFALLIVSGLFLQGCSSGSTHTGNFNSGTEPYIAQAVRSGTIVHVGEASISNTWGTVIPNAVELAVEMDGGETVSVIQHNDNYYAVNDRVRVVFNADGSARAIQ